MHVLHKINYQEVNCVGDFSLGIANQDVWWWVASEHVTCLTCNIMRITVKHQVATQQLWLLFGVYLCLGSLVQNSKMQCFHLPGWFIVDLQL